MRTLALMLCFVACDAGEKKRQTPAPSPPPKPAIVAVTGPDYSYLPADSDLLIHVDVAALRQSKLWPTYEDDVAKLLVPGFAGCDYKPLGDVTTVAVGVPVKSKSAVLVVRGIDRDKALRCLHGEKPGVWTAQFDGAFVTLKSIAGAVDVLTFVDAKTMVWQGAKQPTKATLMEALHTNSRLQLESAFAVPLKKVAVPKAAVTIVSRPGSEEINTQWKTLGGTLQYLYGSMDASDRLQMQFSMVLKTADEATQFATLMQSQIKSPQLKQMFERIDAKAIGDTVVFEVGMTDSQLATIVNMLRAMSPAL